jgi:vesicle coat complex subunit
MKKQRWTQEVAEIERARDENTERKKLEEKIRKLMEKDNSKKSSGGPLQRPSTATNNTKRHSGRPLI